MIKNCSSVKQLINSCLVMATERNPADLACKTVITESGKQGLNYEWKEGTPHEPKAGGDALWMNPAFGPGNGPWFFSWEGVAGEGGGWEKKGQERGAEKLSQSHPWILMETPSPFTFPCALTAARSPILLTLRGLVAAAAAARPPSTFSTTRLNNPNCF